MRPCSEAGTSDPMSRASPRRIQGTEVVARRKEQEFGGVVGVAHAGRAGLGDRGAGDGMLLCLVKQGMEDFASDVALEAANDFAL
jgi:hypothetical protein